jgi:hypothetical protein
MSMFSGLEARSEMNGLLDELYGGGTDRARPSEAREGRRRADRRGAEHLGVAENGARVGGCQSSRVEVVTRQECEEERKQITAREQPRRGGSNAGGRATCR